MIADTITSTQRLKNLELHRVNKLSWLAVPIMFAGLVLVFILIGNM
jgi:hypothetical protein